MRGARGSMLPTIARITRKENYMKESNKKRNARSHAPACSRKPAGWKLPPGTFDLLAAARQRELASRDSNPAADSAHVANARPSAGASTEGLFQPSTDQQSDGVAMQSELLK